MYTVLAVLYFIAVIELHLAISNYVTHPRDLLITTIRPRNLAWPLTFIAFAVLLVYMIYQWFRGNRRGITLTYWGVLLVFGVVIYKFLMVHPVEIAHYFQYAIGAIIVSKAFDPTGREFRYIEVVTITSIAGAFDEFYQFFVHCPAYCRYMDWMDIWMNIIAAGIGGLLMYGFKDYRKSEYTINFPFLKKTFILLGGITLIFGLMYLLGILNFYTDRLIPPKGIVFEPEFGIYLEREPGVYNSWQKTFHTGFFYVPGPLLGISVIYGLYIFLLFYTPGLYDALGNKVWRNRVK